MIAVPAAAAEVCHPAPGTGFSFPRRTWQVWSPEHTAPVPSQRRRILVIEDEAGLRNVVREVLEDEGYEVLAASDGRDALVRLAAQTQPVDLILLDMRMPGMNGWDFARAYRALPGNHAPIVTMTAATDAQQWASEIDAAAYLGKPFDLTDLLDVVEHLLPPASPPPPAPPAQGH